MYAAATYDELGRHDDALALKEEALSFLKRVLPPDHPGIATSMNNHKLGHWMFKVAAEGTPTDPNKASSNHRRFTRARIPVCAAHRTE